MERVEQGQPPTEDALVEWEMKELAEDQQAAQVRLPYYSPDMPEGDYCELVGILLHVAQKARVDRRCPVKVCQDMHIR